MLKGLIEKMVNKAVEAKMGGSTQSSTPDLSPKVAELEAEITRLKEKLASSSAAKALEKLKQLAATVPDGAQGGGMMAVIENGVVKNIELKSKADLTNVIARAEAGELEVLGS